MICSKRFAIDRAIDSSARDEHLLRYLDVKVAPSVQQLPYSLCRFALLTLRQDGWRFHPGVGAKADWHPEVLQLLHKAWPIELGGDNLWHTVCGLSTLWTGGQEEGGRQQVVLFSSDNHHEPSSQTWPPRTPLSSWCFKIFRELCVCVSLAERRCDHVDYLVLSVWRSCN